jgi:hypothetical protein
MLREEKGIYSIKVALLAERGVIDYDPAFWTVDKIISVGPFLSLFLSYTISHFTTGDF